MRFDLLISANHGLDSEWAASRMGATLIAAERETGVRTHDVSSLDPLLQGCLGPQIATALQERPRCVLTWQSTESMEALATASNGCFLVLAPSAAIRRPLDNKIALRRALGELGIKTVPHVICDLKAVDFRDNERRYGLPFVVQLAKGAGGSGTFFISSQDELRALQDEEGEQEVTVSRFISSISPNINAVVCEDQVLLSHPSLQLVGIPQCTGRLSAYCGNDFGAAQRLSSAAVQAIYEQTRKIGLWIARQGFRGLWGLDFVLDGSDVYPLDLNARLQGSTALLTELQEVEAEAPLVLAHALSFLEGGPELLHRLAACWADPRPYHGAQIILRSRKRDWCVVRGGLRPGVYDWDGTRATYRREGLTIADTQAADEFVLTRYVPRVGTRVEAGVTLCKILTRAEVLDGASNKLQPWAAALCRWVYDALALS